MKEQGKIRHYGFSFHSTPEELDEILTAHPDVEFVQLQINYADWENPAIQSRGVYEVARKHGKPVVIMEPVKGGLLANPPEKVKEILLAKEPDHSVASWAVRFAADLEGVLVVLSGMSTLQQMKDNVSYMEDFRPLSEDEADVIESIAQDLYAKRPIRLTSSDPAIHHYIGLYNNRVGLNTRDGWQDIIYSSVKARFNSPRELMKTASEEEKKALRKAIEVYE